MVAQATQKMANQQFQEVSTPDVRVATLAATLEGLGQGASVGVNYYRGNQETKLRFADFALQQECRHILLTPQELIDVTTYVQQRQSSADRALLRLLEDASQALARATDYINECERPKAGGSAVAVAKPVLAPQT